MSDVYPDFVARFYDVIYDRLRTDIDQEFYLERMKQCPGRVMELGVGTGRLFRKALSAGVDIYGIDASQAMLDVLRSRLPAEAVNRVQPMDIRSFQPPQPMQLIVAPFRVFSHLIEVDDQLQALNRAASYLEEGGHFILDLFIPNFQYLVEPPSRVLNFDGEHTPGESLKRFASVKPNPISQVNMVTLEYEWTESGNTQQGTWTFPMRYFFRYELEHLIARSDLKLVNIFGDFEGGPLTDDSQDFVVICRK